MRLADPDASVTPPAGPAAHPHAAAHHPRARAAAGALFIAASALCFGAMPIFGRIAYGAGIDTPTLLLLRFTIAGAVMWALFAARRATLPRGRALATLVGMGALGYAGQAFSYFTALRLGSAGLAALLLYLYPALVAILSRLFFRHVLTRLQLAAIAVALVGSALTIGDAGDATPLAVFFGVLAALIYSGYILTGSRLPASVTPTASAAVVITSAAVVYGAAAAVQGVAPPRTGAGWLAVVAIALVCTVLAIAFFFAGLERIGPVRASVYSTLEPAFTLGLAAALLGEALTPARLAGGALILGAVVLLARADAVTQA